MTLNQTELDWLGLYLESLVEDSHERRDLPKADEDAERQFAHRIAWKCRQMAAAKKAAREKPMSRKQVTSHWAYTVRRAIVAGDPGAAYRITRGFVGRLRSLGMLYSYEVDK